MEQIAWLWSKFSSPKNWEMSADYAAVLSGLIIALLAVGSVQAYTILKQGVKLVDPAEEVDLFHAAQVRIFIALRDGQEPAREDLEVKPGWPHPPYEMTPGKHVWYGLKSAPRNAFTIIPLLAWPCLCVLLCISQMRILIWLGQEKTAGPSPEVALESARAVVFTFLFLISEATIRGFVTAVRRQREAMRESVAAAREAIEQAALTPEEREQVAEIVWRRLSPLRRRSQTRSEDGSETTEPASE